MNEHLEKIEDIEEIEKYYKHELTVTLDQKRVFDADYAESLIPHIVNDIFKLALRMSQLPKRLQSATIKYETFMFNVVKEYHKNGYPHVHATIFTVDPVLPSKLSNAEHLFKRKYGKTTIWATGTRDHYHENDHFKGTWQEYLKKEGDVYTYRFDPWCINTLDPISFI